MQAPAQALVAAASEAEELVATVVCFLVDQSSSSINQYRSVNQKLLPVAITSAVREPRSDCRCEYLGGSQGETIEVRPHEDLNR